MIASPQRGSIRPRPGSAPSRSKTHRTSHKTTPLNHRDYTDTHASHYTPTPTTPKSQKKKKNKHNTYQSDLEFYDPPQYPSPLPADNTQGGGHSPTLGARQRPKSKVAGTFTTFNPDEWWDEQQRQNPDAVYRVAIRRSKSDPVLKRPKSAKSRSNLGGGDQAMSTKDLKSYLTVSKLQYASEVKHTDTVVI